jgi:hypothetical protein
MEPKHLAPFNRFISFLVVASILCSGCCGIPFGIAPIPAPDIPDSLFYGQRIKSMQVRLLIINFLAGQMLPIFRIVLVKRSLTRLQLKDHSYSKNSFPPWLLGS